MPTEKPTNQSANTQAPLHTPGPWIARPKNTPNSDAWWVTAAPLRPGHRGFVAECVARESANEANARLVAAAPDLLKAAREAAHRLIVEFGFDVSQRDVRALLDAVKKAEGK